MRGAAVSNQATVAGVAAFFLLTAPMLRVEAAPKAAQAPAVADGAPGTGTDPSLVGTSLAATAAVRPLMAAPDINILLVPFDSLSVAPPPVASDLPPAITPLSPPATDSAPAGATGAQAMLPRVMTRLLAKKKSNKPDPDAELFKLEPETSGTRPTQPDTRAGAASQPGHGRLELPSPQFVPPGSVSPLPAAPPSLENASGGPGLAQNAAAPLRRALMKVGFLDVLTSSPESPAIRRVINDHRLSPRVLKTLQDNLRLVTAATFTSTQPVPAPAIPVPGPAAPTVAAGSESMAVASAAAASEARRDPVVEQIVLTASRLGQAMGYRSVALMAVQPMAAPGSVGPVRSATYTVLVVDSLRGTSEMLSFDGSGADWMSANEDAASTSASWMLKRLAAWPEVSETQKARMAAEYFQQAKLMARVADPDALEILSQSLALDGNRPEAHVLLGDLLRPTDPTGAAAAYRRALDIDSGSSGETWEKMAVSYASSKDWPRTLDAANKALGMRYDSALLQRTMAVAQFGRGELFRQANRFESADEADNEGRAHLERARAMAPDDPAVTELLARQLVAQGRYAEAAGALDELMTRIDPSLELQTLYATALAERRGREVEAFTAWSRVWKMSEARNVPLTGTRYRRLADGFDQYAVDLARQAAQQAAGVAAGTVPRESALLQLQKMTADMNDAIAAVKIMQPPLPGSGEGGSSSLTTAHNAREFAATLLGQAIEVYSVYIETGDESRRSRGLELHRQAINQLNLARGGGPR